MARTILASFALALLGCGDSNPMPASDASVSDASSGRFEVAPPALPDLGECTTGTVEMRAEGVSICVPPPSTGPCINATAQFLGDAECQRVKVDGCPATDFAPDVPAGATTIYVREGGVGDGSESAPLGTLGEAIAALPAGGTIALGKGTYAETNTAAGGPITIWGACPSETILTLPPTPAASVLRIESSGHELRNVSLGFSPPRSGLVIVDGGLRVENVVIANNGFTGVFLERGSLTGQRLLIRDTGLGPDGGPGGRAINAIAGSTVDLTDIVVEQSLDIAVHGSDADTQITLQRAVIRETRTNLRGELGIGALVNQGATLTIRGGLVERSQSAGVSGISESRITLEDVVVRNTVPNDTPEEGLGLAIELAGGASAVVRRFVSLENDSGIRALGAEIEIEDAVFDDTVAMVETGFGTAFANDATAPATLRRVAILGTPGAGMALGGPTRLEDVIVSGSVQSREGAGAGGISIGPDNRVEATRLRVDRNVTVGILVTAAEFVGEDIDIRNGQPALSGRTGRGLELQDGARGSLTRARLESNREISVYVSGSATALTATELRIVSTLPRACAENDCAGTPAGMGLGAYIGAQVDVDGFEIVDAPLCAVQLATGAQLDLSDGVIADSLVGACVQEPGYDIERIVGSVEFRGNEINVQFDDLEIPDPIAPIVAF